MPKNVLIFVFVGTVVLSFLVFIPKSFSLGGTTPDYYIRLHPELAASSTQLLDFNSPLLRNLLFTKMEMIDSITGNVYCVLIENGRWQKVNGGCASVSSTSTLIFPLTSPNSTSTPETTFPEQSQQLASQTAEDLKNELKQEIKGELKNEIKGLKNELSDLKEKVDQLSPLQQPEQTQSQEQQSQSTSDSATPTLTPETVPQEQTPISVSPPLIPEAVPQPQEELQQQLPDQLPQPGENQLQEVQPEQPSLPAQESPQAGASLLKAFGGFIKWIFISTWRGAVSTTNTIGHSTANLIDSVGIYLQAGSQRVASGATALTANLSDSMKGLWELGKWIFQK
ncbi:MAG: hypothetical protein Q8N81_04425 [bacterium]|nr:hypothetical protein [bacterium]